MPTKKQNGLGLSEAGNKTIILYSTYLSFIYSFCPGFHPKFSLPNSMNRNPSVPQSLPDYNERADQTDKLA